MIMHLFEAKVLINNIPTPMQFKANDVVAAKYYFETFGRVISDIRIVE